MIFEAHACICKNLIAYYGEFLLNAKRNDILTFEAAILK